MVRIDEITGEVRITPPGCIGGITYHNPPLGMCKNARMSQGVRSEVTQEGNKVICTMFYSVPQGGFKVPDAIKKGLSELMKKNQKQSDFIERCINEGNALIEKEVKAFQAKQQREEIEFNHKRAQALAFIADFLPKELNQFINLDRLPLHDNPRTIVFDESEGFCFELILPIVGRLGVSIRYKPLSGNNFEISYHLPKIYKAGEGYQLVTGLNDPLAKNRDYLMPDDVPSHGKIKDYKKAIAYAQRVRDMFNDLMGDHEELC